MRKGKRRNYLHRGISFLLSLVLVIGSFSGALPLGLLSPENVQAVTVAEGVVMALVTQNFSGSPRVSEITEDMVKEVMEAKHEDGTQWSTLNIASVMSGIGDEIPDVSTDDKDTPDDTSDDEEVSANPWTTATDASTGSPFSPGTDYAGNAMNADYTLGDLIIDYTRQNYPAAVVLQDSDIITKFNTMSNDGAAPTLDMTAFFSSLKALAVSRTSGTPQDQTVEEVLNTSDYIKYSDYVIRNGALPGGTLFIGTWLMDAQAINSTMYRMAVRTMTADDQLIMYYKSELASNRWRDIYGATGLEDILPIAENVDESSLADYYVSIVVGSDGIPRNAKTEEVVDIFNLTDPYDLENLPEFKALKLHMDVGTVSATDEGSKRYVYDRVHAFFNSCDDYDYENSNLTDEEFDQQNTQAVNYVFDVASRTGIGFYAPDVSRTTDRNAYHERYWCADVSCDTQAHDASKRSIVGYEEMIDTDACWEWRYEESGRGFLESLETMAEYNSHPDFRFYYSNGSSYTPVNKKDQDAKLIRGSVSWINEIKWRAEVTNDLGGGSEAAGLTVLRSRLWKYIDIWKHFSNTHDRVTASCDTRLENMGNIYTQLRETGTKEDQELSDMAMLVQERLDAQRRAEVYYNLIENEEANYGIGPSLNMLYSWVSYGESDIGRNYELLFHTDDNFEEVSSITEAVESAVTDCSQSYIQYSAQALSEGSTIISKTEFALMDNVINNAASGPEVVRPDLRQLVDLENISNNVIAHKSRELNFLNSTLLPTADAKFREYVHQSAGETYREAAADPNTQESTLDEILQDQKADVSSVAGELQRFIKARCMRVSTKEAIDYVYERIDWAEAQRAAITMDAFGTYAGEALDDHIRWLKDLLATISEGGDLEDEGTSLVLRRAELESDLIDAFNDGDTERAEKLEGDLEELGRLEEEYAAKRADIAADPNASAAQKYEGVNSQTPTAKADEIVDKLLGDISEGDYSSLPESLNALESLGSPRINEVIAALEAHGAGTDLINLAKKAKEGSGESEFADMYADNETDRDAILQKVDEMTGNGGSGDGNTDDGSGDTSSANERDGSGDTGEGNTGENSNNDGSGDNTGGNNTGDGNTGGVGGDAITGAGTGLTQANYESKIRQVFGKDFGDLSDLDQASVVTGLTQFATARDDKAAYDLAIDLLEELIREHSPFLYRQYLSDASKEYVSLEAIDRCRKYTRFRRVRDSQGVSMAQIVGGSASYVFYIGLDKVESNNGKKDQMDAKVVTQEDESLYGNSTAKYAYIAETDSGKYLYNTCCYVPGTTWAVLITPQTDRKIALFLDQLDIEADGE
ncbi:MAG: hypothetical protein K6G07_02390 [Lachnospiraceae bacterium]|nr:hypothetical protein [Lachnospiraceae bacterium]